MKRFSNKKINFIAAILLIIFIILFSFGDFSKAKKASAAWYATGGTWNYRKQITVDPEKVSGSSNLTDFPMLFKVTDADLKHTDHGGKMGKIDATDMLFTSSDGSTKLSHEIEYYASTTGEIIAWVKVPTLYTSQQTPIYVYFGNSGASDQQNVTGVWDSNFKGVWHLPNGTSLSVLDSTNQNNGTNNGASANTAQIDGGGLFNGSSHYIEASTSPIVAGTASFTISAWIRTTSSNTTFGKSIYAERATSGQDIVKLDSTDLGSPNGVFITYRNSAGSLTQLRGPAIINDNQLHHVVGTLSGGTLNVYVDGRLDATGARGGNDTLTDAGKRSWIGGDYGDSNAYFSGTLDEVRVSSVARSADWIATEYNNQSSPSTFYAYGGVGVQTRSGSGVALDDKGGSGLTWYATGGTWGYRKQITVDPEKVSGSSNLTDFPMLFKVTDADLKHTDHGGKMGKIDATDMLFTSSDGSTKLSHEIEYYASTTGEIIAWVKVPTLYTAQQTPIYVYFGNSGASDQQNVTGVWDSNFKGVWHLPNGTTLSASDSTSNANNGVATNATAASGYIGGAASFDGTDDEILVTRNAGTDDINAKTVSLWVRHNEVAFDHLFGKHSGTNVWNISIDSSNFINFRQVFSGGTATWTSASTVPVSSWTHVVLAYDRTSASNDPTIYINGVASSLGTDTNSTGSANTDASNDIYMGETGNAGSDLNGLLDEVRFSNVIRSSDWIKSEYNNQSSPPTFYSYGALESNSRKNSAGSSESAVKVRGGVKFR